ncbi:MAG TPA: hypothetical protein VNF06_01910 [Candidatus Aquilonibacter sp.]|nr:hypothetical protein [Candidatus Aquilonibacter sp.]
MDSKIMIGGGVVVVLIIAVAVYSFSMSGTSSPQTTTIQGIITNPTTTVAANNSTSNTTTSIAPTTTVGVLFNSTAHASSSYQIFPVVELSQNGKTATSDFTLSQRPVGAGTSVTMTFMESGLNYSVIVNPGETLYFIDTNLGDDNPSFDGNSGDDGYALVDSNGYIVSTQFPLPGT